MQLKDLPECAQSAACNLLADACHGTPNKTAEAERIRDAFIALYSEAENAGTYENLKSAAEDTAGSIFSKKYSPCGTHVGNVYFVIEDGIPDAPEIGEFKNMFVFAPRGIEGFTKEKTASEPEQPAGKGDGMTALEPAQCSTHYTPEEVLIAAAKVMSFIKHDYSCAKNGEIRLLEIENILKAAIGSLPR